MYHQIHVEEEVDKDSWMHHTRQRLVFGSDGPKHEEHLIYRVHSFLRNVNARSYEPIATSIGPYYHGKKHLLDMETHKKRYFRHLLSRNENVRFEDPVKMMKETEEQVRACYPGKIKLKSNAFVEMMLLDGCFIVELLLKYDRGPWDDDLINGPPWRLGFLQNRDLLLLENQLPFFLLQKIFKTVMPNEDHFTFVKLCFNFLKISMQTLIVADPPMAPEFVYHLLHLWHAHLIRIPAEPLQDSKILNLAQCFGMCNCWQETTQEKQKQSEWMPSVTQLEEAGVKFKASSNNLLAIKFSEGELIIPNIIVSNKTEAQLRNLVVFEQCSLVSSQKHYFSSYVIFMDRLINTSKDVEILHKKGILRQRLGEDEQGTLY